MGQINFQNLLDSSYCANARHIFFIFCYPAWLHPFSKQRWASSDLAVIFSSELEKLMKCYQFILFIFCRNYFIYLLFSVYFFFHLQLLFICCKHIKIYFGMHEMMLSIKKDIIELIL
jgi:hypothetical protein